MPTKTVKLSSIIAPAFHDLTYYALHDPSITEIIAEGGRGGTKSSWAGLVIFAGLHGDPKAHAFISRRYDIELRNSVFTLMIRVAERMKISHEWKFTEKPMRARNTKTGQLVLFQGVDDPNKSKSTEVPFGYFKYLWMEEVDQYGGMEDVRKVKQSILRGEGGKRLMIMTFNPPKSDRSWINHEVMIPKIGRMVHHSSYLGEWDAERGEWKNPVPPEWLGETFLAEAEHLKKTNELAYRHEYLGEKVGTGLEVFKNIVLESLSDEQCAAFINVRQGLDWGYAVDPVALIRASYDRKRRWLYIFGERSGIGIGNRELDDITPDDWKDTQTYADAAEPKSIDEMRNEYGWKIVKAEKGPGSVNRGVKWLADLEKIIIDPTRCPRSAKEFMNYALEVRKGGEVISEYPDKDNHCLDAARYCSFEWMRPEAPERPQVRNIPTVSHW